MIKVKLINHKTVKDGDLTGLRGTKFTVVDCHKPTVSDLKEISVHTEIPLTELKDATNDDARPKAIDIGNYFVISFRTNIKKRNNPFGFTLVTFFCCYKKNNVIIIHNEKIPAIDQVLDQDDMMLIKHMDNRKSSLIFRMLTEMLQDSGEFLEKLEEEVDRIEKGVFRKSDKNFLSDIFKIKKNIILFHKEFVANREALSNLPMMLNVDKRDHIAIADLKADCSQFIETVSVFREFINGTMEVHISLMSHDMNMIMKRITGFGAVIMIPTLIASIYGMNFAYMPELEWKWGYFASLGVMFLIVVILFIYFKKKDWI